MVRLKGFTKLTRIEEALQSFFERLQPKRLDSERIHIGEAYGRVMAGDIVAKRDLPPFDRSAVDGYAVHAEDTLNASVFQPKKLKVVDKEVVGCGEAKTIWTGNPLPEGANAVVMLEHTKKLNDEIEVLKAVAVWENVSRKGEDIREGEVVIKAGTRLRAQHLGLLAALGLTEIEVVRKPRVAIFATGNELVNVGDEPADGQIIETNRLVLSSLCQELGAVTLDFGIVKDDESLIRERLLDAASKADVVVTTGGTSVGKADLVPYTIKKINPSSLVAHGIAMRPAMPTGLAVLRGKPVVILSGNPVAAVIGFEVFVRPLVLRLLGAENEARPRLKAKLTRRVVGVLGRRAFLRVRVFECDGEFLAEPVRVSGSSVLTTLTRANGYVIIPENREVLEEGEEVMVHLFDNVPLGVS